MQGLGWLTLEELMWDSERPPRHQRRIHLQTPVVARNARNLQRRFPERATEPGVIFGSKAVGEPPLMLAFSVREAIREAIAAFGAGGLVTLDSPATPGTNLLGDRRSKIANSAGRLSPWPEPFAGERFFALPFSTHRVHTTGALDDSMKMARSLSIRRKNCCVRRLPTVRNRYPEADSPRPAAKVVILPGFIDTHIHFPQVRILGGLGYSLLDWLEQLTLPEEAKFADLIRANHRGRIRDTISPRTEPPPPWYSARISPAQPPPCLKHPHARACASSAGLSCRTAGCAPNFSRHPKPHTRHAKRSCIHPRQQSPGLRGHAQIRPFGQQPMLEVCRTLLRENPDLLFTTHINENPAEIEEVAPCSRLPPIIWTSTSVSI